MAANFGLRCHRKRHAKLQKIKGKSLNRTIDINNQTTSRKNAGRRSKTEAHIRALGDLLADDTITPRKQLCGPWLLERGFSMVFAPTGVGKSWFAMGVAAAVAGGGNFGHWSAPEPRNVLYIDGEMDLSDLKGRFQAIVEAADGVDKISLLSNLKLFARHDQPENSRFPDFGSEEESERIIKLVRSNRPDLVVLDNLSTLATVDDNNASEAWDPFLRLLQRIRAAGAAVFVVHHSNKGGETYHGSSKIPVMFDALVRLRPDPRPLVRTGAAFMLDFTKTRMLTEDAGKTYNIGFEDNSWCWDLLVSQEVRSLVQRILAGEFQTQKQAAEVLNISPGEVSKKLTDACNAGIITRQAIQGALQAARDVAAEDHELF